MLWTSPSKISFEIPIRDSYLYAFHGLQIITGDLFNICFDSQFFSIFRLVSLLSRMSTEQIRLRKLTGSHFSRLASAKMACSARSFYSANNWGFKQFQSSDHSLARSLPRYDREGLGLAVVARVP